ncbi:MAG: OB-fold nucleic acid binding domain-containing protein [Promethearchaeota archaeon]
MKLRPRLTAYKLHISDLYAGSYTREGNRSFLETSIGPVVRVRLLGTIMQRYDNVEKRYTSLTLDDATETIRLKAWREDCEKLADFQVGDIIDVVGKVRQQDDGELFIVPENVIKVEDVNIELLRELEIIELHHLIGGKSTPKKEPEMLLKKEPEKVEPTQEIETDLPQGSENDIKDDVMRLIRTLDTGKGASYKDIVEQTSHLDEDAVETAIMDLLNEGVIYEPEAGYYKEL